MNLYPDMFLSKWHLITLLLIVIAWFALWIGGYDRKTILRSGIGAVAVLYAITTIPIAVFTYQEHRIEEAMLAELNRVYSLESNAGTLVAAAGSFRDIQGRYSIRLYAANFSPSEPFEGTLTIWITDTKGREPDVRTYPTLTLQPGERKELDAYTTYTGALDSYRYQFVPSEC